MQTRFDLRASRCQRRFYLSIYAALFCMSLIYHESNWAWPGLAALAVLFAVRDLDLLEGNGCLTIELFASDRHIVVIERGQPYFYRKYKVYACRWFAILRLVDQPESRSLLLISDRFKTEKEYRDLRHHLVQFVRLNHAD